MTYSLVKLNQGHLVDQVKAEPGVFVKACRKLGLDIVSGKGSHVCVWIGGSDHAKSVNLVATIPRTVHKQTKRDIIKKIISIGGCSEEDVWKAFGIKNI